MDWSELNTDLLRLIAKKLGDISNFVHFRVVCKHWRSAVPPSELPPQFPWFIDRVVNWRGGSSEIQFYSLYSNKTYTLHVPEADGKIPLGPSNKYLCLTDFSCMTSILINPCTRSKIRVPYQL
ncbi:hypothetical protein LUZ60_008139 [Juncus effusus]|nr:hypothetical protein LUZ60_008139 [Juncus effusus]